MVLPPLKTGPQIIQVRRGHFRIETYGSQLVSINACKPHMNHGIHIYIYKKIMVLLLHINVD